MHRKKSSFQRLGVLLLLAVVGFGTHSNAQALVGPADVNDGIKLWLDADKSYLHIDRNCSGVNPNPGDDVKCWRDRSGNNAHVTTKHKRQDRDILGAPTYEENKIGGQPVLEFKTTGSGLDKKEGLVNFLERNGNDWEGNYTLFLVVKQIETDSNNLKKRAYFSNGKGDSHVQIGFGNNNTNKTSLRVWYKWSPPNSPEFEDNNPVNTDPRIYAVRENGTHTTTYTDGNKIGFVSSPQVQADFDEYQINLDRGRNKHNHNYIAEVVLYDRNLNDCEFYDVHKYLADKYELRGTPIIADGLTLIDEANFLKSDDDEVLGSGDPEYFVIHGTDDSDLPRIHTGGGSDIIYIKDWGANRDSMIQGAHPNPSTDRCDLPDPLNGDLLIWDDYLMDSDCPVESWESCQRICFTTGGSICYQAIEYFCASSMLEFDYGGLEDPPGGCEEDVCVGGNVAPVGVPAPVSFSSRSLGSDTLVFLGEFDFDDWSGDLKAYALEDDGSLAETETWSAAEILDDKELPDDPTFESTSHNDTSGSSTGEKFDWGELNGFPEIADDLNAGDDQGQERLDYLRGDHSDEIAKGGTFRDRHNSRLGDIFRSRPVYVGVPNLAWPDTGSYFGDKVTTRYSDFKKEQQCRTPMVYVGANDGALHGFRAETGKEVLRYFPGSLYNAEDKAGYHFLTDPDYDHLPYVDGTPVVSDAYIKTTSSGDPSWRTILVGTLGGGGTGLFALDVTDSTGCSPAWSSTKNDVLWEFTQDNFEHLGYSYSRPTVALLNNGRWAAITGNGDVPDDVDLDGYLLILYLEGGMNDWSNSESVEDYIVIPTDESGGLSSPTVIDTDGDGVADRAYAGDSEGNLWVFDLSNPNPVEWENEATLLFENDRPQPITVKPTVVRHPTVANDNSNAPNVMVLFGTGRLNTEEDKEDTAVQTFYGIWDNPSKRIDPDTDPDTLIPLTLDNLVAQEFVFENEDTRITDPSLEVDYEGGKFGWYIDLPEDTGERVVSDAVARGDMIFFNTVIPTDNPCEYGGTGWEMSVRIENGGSPMTPVVDQDGSGHFTNQDTIEVTLAGSSGPTPLGPSGTKFEDDEGLPSGPAIVGDKLFTRGSNEDEPLKKVTALAPVTDSWPVGRLDWEQLFHSQ